LCIKFVLNFNKHETKHLVRIEVLTLVLLKMYSTIMERDGLRVCIFNSFQNNPHFANTQQ
jgi:hypothetical protein